MRERRFGWIIAILLPLAFIGWGYWSESQNLVLLKPDGKVTFLRGGFFHRDQFYLKNTGGKWQFFSEDKDNYDSGDFIVPFECKYNENYTLRLEPGGKVSLLDKKRMSRMELRLVNNEWSYDAGDHWHSIFDFESFPL